MRPFRIRAMARNRLSPNGTKARPILHGPLGPAHLFRDRRRDSLRTECGAVTMRYAGQPREHDVRNPIPKRYRKSADSLLFFVLVYLAATGLHAIIDGRARGPSWFVVAAFLAGALIAVYVRGAMHEEESS